MSCRVIVSAAMCGLIALGKPDVMASQTPTSSYTAATIARHLRAKKGLEVLPILTQLVVAQSQIELDAIADSVVSILNSRKAMPEWEAENLRLLHELAMSGGNEIGTRYVGAGRALMRMASDSSMGYHTTAILKLGQLADYAEATTHLETIASSRLPMAVLAVATLVKEPLSSNGGLATIKRLYESGNIKQQIVCDEMVGLARQFGWTAGQNSSCR